jgi:predicted transcriptional regulator of viral defense system
MRQSHRKRAITELNAREYIDSLTSTGCYHFTTEDACRAFESNPNAVRAKLRRLKKQGLTAEPVRSFHVIVPSEYRCSGCPPAEHFIDQLMYFLREPYYICLLTASEKYVAVHQRPQHCQVMVQSNRRSICCGSILIKFIARKNTADMPVSTTNTPNGVLRCATPEVTALELMGYPKHSGGLSNAATVALDLARNLDPEKLLAAASVSPISWAQRLGYIYDSFGEESFAEFLSSYVREHASSYVPLRRAAPIKGSGRSGRWKILINCEVELEE